MKLETAEAKLAEAKEAAAADPDNDRLKTAKRRAADAVVEARREARGQAAPTDPGDAVARPDAVAGRAGATGQEA